MGVEKVEFEFPHEETGESDSFELEIEPSPALEVGAEPAEEPAPEPEPEPAPEPEPEPEPEIEEVDDTPVQDRGRKKSDPPEELTDEELEAYSEKVAKRIKHFSKGYHDERREKERAMRERDELENYARTMMAENEKLKKNVGLSQETLYRQAKVTVEGQLANAKREYKEAYEAGNADALVEAQEKLTTAKMRHYKLAQIKIPSLQEQPAEVQQVQQAPEQVQQPQYRPDERAVKWTEENTWFGPDDEMTSFALGFHNKLVKNGIDPTSDEYYEKLNSRMREVFPDNFEEASTQDEEVGRKKQPSSNVVAPATRTTGPKRIKLTKSQVAIAKKLGVPLSEYAKQVANEMGRSS